MKLQEFFKPLIEGPLDGTFKSPAEAPVPGAAPAAPGAPEATTQDVRPVSEGSFTFFQEAGQRFCDRHNDEESGQLTMDPGAVQAFAAMLDNLAFQTYQGLSDPEDRNKYESDIVKVSADFQDALHGFIADIEKLKKHANPY